MNSEFEGHQVIFDEHRKPFCYSKETSVECNIHGPIFPLKITKDYTMQVMLELGASQFEIDELKQKYRDDPNWIIVGDNHE